MVVDVVLVGLGEIGLNAHLPALLRHRGFRLIGLVDPDARARERASDLAPAVPVAATVDDILDPVERAAVVIATPPWVSTALTARLAGAGHPVLMEKPVAISSQAAGVLQTLAPAAAHRVQVGMTYRHHPALVALHDWITAGVLGSPLLVRAHIYDERLTAADPSHADRLDSALAHALPVVHEGAHIFDWLHYLLGPPEHVDDRWELQTDRRWSGPNIAGGRLSYPDGSTALVEVGWLTPSLPPCELTVQGAGGYAVLDIPTFHLRLSTAAGNREFTVPGDRTVIAFDRQLDRFHELITQGGEPEPSLNDGLRALKLAETLAGVQQ